MLKIREFSTINWKKKGEKVSVSMKKKGLTMLLVLVIVVVAECLICAHFVNKWIDDGTLVVKENGKSAGTADYAAEMMVSDVSTGINMQ